MFLPRKGAGFKVFGTLMAWKISHPNFADSMGKSLTDVSLPRFIHSLYIKTITTRSFSTSLDFFSGIRFLLVIWNSPGTVEGPSKTIVFTTVCPNKKAFRNPKVHIYPFLFHWKKMIPTTSKWFCCARFLTLESWHTSCFSSFAYFLEGWYTIFVRKVYKFRFFPYSC